MSNNKIICCIDSDGVLFNFLKSACKILNIEYPKNYQFNSDTWLYDKCGLSKKQFWQKIKGHDFWSNLSPYPWSKDLINIVNNNSDDWIILSKPSLDSGAYSGKFESFQKNFGIGNRLWLSARNKEYFAGLNKILIDDKKENCEKWASFGGFSYHWPEVTDDFDINVINKRLSEIEDLIKHVRWYNNQ